MADEHDFEKKMKRLEEIVSLLEDGEISLEESMSLYREGMQCSRFCRDELVKARQEVEIEDLDGGGNAWPETEYDEDNIPF